MSMKIKKGDLVQVITGRTSDADKIAKRNETRAEKGKGELAAGDKGKQGRVLQVHRAGRSPDPHLERRPRG